MLLTLDLIPSCLHGFNARKVLTAQEWNTIRQKTFRLHNFKCQICGASENLECHEKFEINETNYKYKLTELMCLCKLCHSCKHIARLFKERRTFWESVNYIQKINNWSRVETLEHIKFEMGKCRVKDNKWWEFRFELSLDLSLIGYTSAWYTFPIYGDVNLNRSIFYCGGISDLERTLWHYIEEEKFKASGQRFKKRPRKTYQSRKQRLQNKSINEEQYRAIKMNYDYVKKLD